MGLRSFRRSSSAALQPLPVLRMDQGADVLGGDAEMLPVDAEDAVLAVVPKAFAGVAIPVPRAHVAGGERQAAAFLALPQLRGRRFELGGARRDALLQLGVHLLELARLAVELDEDLDLGPQHLRNDRHRDVVDRAHLVAAQAIHVGQMNGGDEDHRGLLEPRMLADHRGELEAVEVRHADVHQDDRDLRLQQILQRLLAGRGLDQVFVELMQDDLVAQQLGRLVVDQQDVDLVVFRHGDVPDSTGAATCAARTSSCSVLTGLAR